MSANCYYVQSQTKPIKIRNPNEHLENYGIITCKIFLNKQTMVAMV